MNRIQRRQKASYGQLEDRRLLAGDVRLFMGGNLFLRGDNQDNGIEVRVINDGDIQIQGLNGTTINGQSEPLLFEGMGGMLDADVRANLRGGNDLLRVEGLILSGDARVVGGNGNDSIGLYNSSAENVFVRTGRGDDSVSLDGAMIRGNLSANTWLGDDVVGVDGSVVEGLTLLYTGSGNDDVAIRNSEHLGPVVLNTSLGDDFVGTDGLMIGRYLALSTGFGTDDVYVNDTSFGGTVFANGGIEFDNLEIDGDTTFARDPFVRSFEGNDVAGGRLQIDDAFDDLILSGSRLGTITELAVLTPDLSTLVGALGATGLDGALNGAGPFTVFAPLNSAFELLPPGTLNSLTQTQLTDVLLFHVAADEVFANELVELDEVDTLLGESFDVDVRPEGVILNGNVTLNQTDIRAKNGVIHLVNEVLLPS